MKKIAINLWALSMCLLWALSLQAQTSGFEEHVDDLFPEEDPIFDYDLPDLIINSATITVASDGVGASESFNASCSMRNVGGQGVYDAKMFYVLSTDSHYSASSDVKLAEDTHSGWLNPNNTAYESATLTIPPGTLPGTYYILFVADPEDQVLEMNESNNRAFRSFQVKVLPDLYVDELRLASGAPLYPGGTVSLEGNVKNQGPGGDLLNEATFFLSTEPELGFILTDQVYYLGRSNDFTDEDAVTFALPSDVLPGDYYIIAKADPDDDIAESNPDNNTSAIPVTLLPPQPDLVINNVNIEGLGDGVIPGLSFDFHFRLKNQGVEPVTNPVVHLVLSEDGNFDPLEDDVLVVHVVEGVYDWGQQEDLQLSGLIPSSRSAGSYTLFVVADPEGAVDEWDEANNIRSEQVVVYTPDEKLNTIESRTYTYDKNGERQVLTTGKSYFDLRGHLLQSQTKNLTENRVFASQPIYDSYDRPSAETMAAPIPSDTFRMAFDFVTNGGKRYGVEQLAGNHAAPVDEESLLGRYFSGGNTEELATPISQFPMRRTEYYADGSGEVKRATGPGEAFHTSIFKRAYSKTFPVINDLDGVYLQVRNLLILDNTSSLSNQLVKSISRDVSGREVVTYLDAEEKVLASGYAELEGAEAIAYPLKYELEEELQKYTWFDLHVPSTATAPVLEGGTLSDLRTESLVLNRNALKGFYRCVGCERINYTFSYYNLSFNFYDNRGRLIVTVPPLGVKYLLENANSLTREMVEDIPYAIYNVYDFEGRLLETREPDAGVTRFMYRIDGALRFSENALQREKGTFSYTNYDWDERPVESGEYVGSTFAFGSPELTAQLEDRTPSGGIILQESDRNDWLISHYDLPYAAEAGVTLPGAQTYTYGGVSYTENQHAATWYSYDELGRTTWMATWYRDMPGSPVKTSHYTYDFTGNVVTVAYQQGASDAFYHHYMYDADSRLSKVYAATLPIDPEALREENLQATYHYYLHGPLKQVVLADGLQETDFYYTLQGWLKSINDPSELGDDAFAQAFHYYPGDYSSTAVTDNFGHTLNAIPQYGGTISSLQWQTRGNPLTAFNYRYDGRYQLVAAKQADGTDSFEVDQLVYDAHSNLLSLRRRDEQGSALHDLIYEYNEPGHTNQVSNVVGYAEDFDYDALGQLVRQVKEGKTSYIDYNVSGYVTGVYADEARTKPILTNTYDDKGFRLSKTAYDTANHAPTFKTWYVRDATGAELTVYVENLKTGSEPQPYEVSIYGANRLGMYRPAESKSVYELKDHLGNVRAVLGGPQTVDYRATMESEEATTEEDYFEINSRTTVAAHLNHTPEVEVAGANEAIRINNYAAFNPIGAGKALQVFADDKVNVAVYVKYEDLVNTGNQALPAIAMHLAQTFEAGVPAAEGGGIFDIVDDPSSWGFTAINPFDDQQPRIYLNYLLYDRDFQLVDYGFDQVSEAARIPSDGTPLGDHAFERLEINVNVQQSGFLYVYVSNENENNITAYFDDMEVNHTLSPVQYAADYYPFGLAQEERTLERTAYRKGYQGDFADYDEETGWNHFEVRELDPVMGRWLSVDPARQFWSPYVSMGNNPVNAFDPDGALAIPDPIGDIYYTAKYLISLETADHKELTSGIFSDYPVEYPFLLLNLIGYGISEITVKGSSTNLAHIEFHYAVDDKTGEVRLLHMNISPISAKIPLTFDASIISSSSNMIELAFGVKDKPKTIIKSTTGSININTPLTEKINAQVNISNNASVSGEAGSRAGTIVSKLRIDTQDVHNIRHGVFNKNIPTFGESYRTLHIRPVNAVNVNPHNHNPPRNR